MTKSYKYRIGEAADDPGWFGAFYKRSRCAVFNGTPDQLARDLNVPKDEVYDGNHVYSPVEPVKKPQKSTTQ